MNQNRSAGDSLLITAYVCDAATSNNTDCNMTVMRKALLMCLSDLESQSLWFGVGCLNAVSVVSGGEIYSVNNQEILTAICSCF